MILCSPDKLKLLYLCTSYERVGVGSPLRKLEPRQHASHLVHRHHPTSENNIICETGFDLCHITPRYWQERKIASQPKWRWLAKSKLLEYAMSDLHHLDPLDLAIGGTCQIYPKYIKTNVPGAVQAWVGQNGSWQPHINIKVVKWYLVTESTNDLTNTITMVVEQLSSWIWWIHTAGRVGSLAHMFFQGCRWRICTGSIN